MPSAGPPPFSTSLVFTEMQNLVYQPLLTMVIYHVERERKWVMKCRLSTDKFDIYQDVLVTKKEKVPPNLETKNTGHWQEKVLTVMA